MCRARRPSPATMPASPSTRPPSTRSSIPARASYEVSDLQNALLTLTMTNIRTVVGSMDLDQLLSHRDEINERLLRVMDAAASPWGVKVTRIEIKDILPPADLAGAMARQMKAEREKRAAVLEAEGLRQAEILRAEGQKQSQILAAEGRKEAAFRDAEARERSAEAEAKATTMVSEAIARGDLAGANFLVAEKYIEAIRALATAPNQKVLIVPTELGGLAGTLGGIAEITRVRVRRRRRACRLAGARACRRRRARKAEAMIPSLIDNLGPWSWIVLGLALMGLELLAPGAFLLWLGFAGVLTGMLDWWLGLSWQAALLVFAALSVASVLAGRA